MASKGGASGPISFEIAGEQQLKVGIGRMVHALGDLRPFWNAAFRPAFLAVEAEQFASQGAAGRAGPWAKLSPDYAAAKAAHGYPSMILVRTGALRASLLGGKGSVFESHPAWMAIGTSVPYGIYHQTGGGSLPRRRPVDISSKQETAVFGRALGLVARDLGKMWESGPLSSVRG